MNALTFWTVKFFFDLFMWWSNVGSGEFALAWLMVLTVALDLVLVGFYRQRRAR